MLSMSPRRVETQGTAAFGIPRCPIIEREKKTGQRKGQKRIEEETTYTVAVVVGRLAYPLRSDYCLEAGLMLVEVIVSKCRN